jgi:fructose-specific phosphotransferase system IIA component
MRLAGLLSADTITLSLEHGDKNGVIEELVGLAMASGKIKNRSTVLKAVMDREELGSTGLEKGVAVPHGKTKAVQDLVMALGISKEGLDFKAQDNKPSHLFFLLLAPEAEAGPHVKALAQIARLTNNPDFRESLLKARSPEEAIQIFKDAE